jgi:trk system potassium uptake protein TrkH
VVVSAVVITALVQKWSIVLMANASRPAYAGTYRVMAATVTFGGVAIVLIHSQRLARFFVAFAEQPARQTALSFFAVTLFGAFLLTMPVCVRDPSHVAFVDALFMATSAVCVTGLAVHGVATEYTLVGQGVLLALVQVGGLGIMVLSASVVVLTGRKLRARSSAVLAEVLDTDSIASLRGTIRGIVGFTLVIELVGAVLLYSAFAQHPHVALGIDSPQPASGSGGLIWAAIFHAVSAFCNAGFSLMHGGLEPFVSSYAVSTIVMVLIVLGGLGFPVLSELLRWGMQRVHRKRPLRLSLHTRIVLLMSAGLIVAVGLVLLAVEWKGALAGLPWHVRVFAALFQSVTLRTAGFNTVSFGAFTNAGLMIAMLFMFIGASPGGTGGGVKVTTFAVLFATLRAELGHGREPHLLDRRLPPGIIRRAISVVFMAVIVLTFSVLGLLLSEDQDALRLAFEAVSAFGTVGLSTGITPELTTVGKLVIIVTMLIGRVGPLTVALATAERSDRAHHQRPHERVLIG